MNDRGLDRLFRERLQDFQTAPSGATWNKLETKLASRKKALWWKLIPVAAALALIALSVYVITVWNVDSSVNNLGEISGTSTETTSENSQTSQNQNLTTETEMTSGASEEEPLEAGSQNQGTIAEDLTQDVTKDETENIPQLVTVDQANNTSPNPAQKEVFVNENPQEESGSALDEISSEPNSQKEPEGKLAEDYQSGQESPNRPKVTITYKKAPSPPEPTLALMDNPEEKSSRAQKIWRKAQALKSAELDLGKLRAAKNQLLVFNKKNKDKQTKSN